MIARSLTCPMCGGRTKIEHGLQEAVCQHCGQEVRLSQAVLEEQQRAARYPPTTPLRVGMKAKYRGTEYEATGRQVLSDEEGSQWEEWVLVSPEGHLLYLEFDEGKWKISEPFVPQNPLGPAELAVCGEGGVLPVDGHRPLVTGNGLARVVHAEGEFPWLVTIGRTARYLDATSGDSFYSVEWTEDAVEYYHGQFLGERHVFWMFGLQDLIRELDRREAALRSKRRFGAWCLAAAVAGFLLWGVAMTSGTSVANASGSVPAASLTQDGVRFGPFVLSAVGRVHRLQIEGRMREQSVWMQAVLEDEEEQELIGADRDMWDESGYDDGYWHESDLRASTDFVLKKAGNYYVRLYAEPDPGKTVTGDVTASFTIKEKAMFPHYLGFYALGAFLLGLVFLLTGSPGTVTKMKQGIQSDDD